MPLFNRTIIWFLITTTLSLPVLAQPVVRNKALTYCKDSIISFEPRAKVSEMRCLINGPNGSTYQLTLDPQEDLNGNVVALNLEVISLRSKSVGNVLEIDNKAHGYQLFNFAASDFKLGARKSVYGEVRAVQNTKLKILVTIDAVDSKVTPISQSDDYYHLQFESLTLHVDVKDINVSTANGK